MTVEKPVSSEGLRSADFVKSGHGQGEAIERAPGIYESRGVGNSYLITTPEGDVVVNAGVLSEARRGKELFTKVSSGPVRYIVLTQSHLNQYGGVEVFKTPEAQLVAHRLYPEGRAYADRLREYYGRRAGKIWTHITGNSEVMRPTQEFAPDILVDDRFDFTLGGRKFEVLSTPGGETRDALIVWLPNERVAIVGNLFGPIFGNHPNLNTVRGDKPRWALQFVESAKRLRALEPQLVLTGHEALEGAANIQTGVTRLIDAVQWVHDKTVEGMNAGKDLHTLMREVTTPPELTLTEEYGRIAWNVRATWNEYSGWFDYDEGTTALYDVPRRSVSPDLVALAGGADRLAERAHARLADGQPLEALHLIDIALDVEPANAAARAAKHDALSMLLTRSKANLWETMWLRAELAALA
jgi:alkyl sulfatase BDS1-like metallo-beta-lactamase superfamily hydrolase